MAAKTAPRTPPDSAPRRATRPARAKSAPPPRAKPEPRVADLERALARAHRTSTALREVSLALGATLDLDELLQLILDKITGALEADRATLYLLDDDRDELVSRVLQGDEVLAIRLPIGKGIAGHVAKTGKPLLVPDAYADKRFSREWDRESGYRTKAILAVPMKNHFGRTIGVIQVLNKREDASEGSVFTDEDAVLLAALASHAAISIELSRLFSSVTRKNAELVETQRQLEHRVHDLKLLFDLESAMGRAASLEELCRGVLAEACRATVARAGAFLIRDGQSELVDVFHYDASAESFERIAVGAAKGFGADAMRSGQVVHVDDATRDPRRHEGLPQPSAFECASAVAVPLEGDGGLPLGAVVLYGEEGARSFDDEDRGLLLLIAANASTALKLQLARDERERGERLTTIGRLLSGVLHDLKTPLTVISGYVQMMEHADDRAARAEYAELALKQFEHIVAMQKDVLEFARGERSILVRKVYLGAFFEDVKRQLETSLAKSGVVLRVELADKGTARFDEGKVLRVIQNLARNASEAMAPRGGGTFTIASSRSGKDLVLTFTDTGPGIPKPIEHRLFESFVTSGKQGGTGLGLAITKRIAEEHGGTIAVRSSSKGATFTLRLPQEE